MAIIAITPEYLVEDEGQLLTISRYSDGHCLALPSRGNARQFRLHLETVGAERAVLTFLRICYKFPWQPLYKPECMPRSMADSVF